MASTYLERTPSSAGNRKTFTFSAWIKRNLVNATQQNLLAVSNATNDFSIFYIDTTESLTLNLTDNGSYSGLITTNRKFRDVSAWYHIVLAVDTTQATASDRVKIYVNGVQETSFSTSSYPSQNYEGLINTGLRMDISGQGSAWSSGTQGFDGLMSHIHFIDGTAYDASAFGEIDANGVWKIKTSPSVTYGTNGFFILKDGNSVTDQSGNGNNWTAGGTLTKTEDNPSNVFATLNTLADNGMGGTYSYGNTQVQSQTSNRGFAIATLGASSGKWYWEIKTTATGGTNPGDEWNYIGIATRPNAGSDNILGESGTNSNKLYEYALYAPDGGVYNNGTKTAYAASFTQGDTLSFALDLDNSRCYVAKNGLWCDSGAWSASTPTTYFSITSASSTPDGFYFPAFGDGGSNVNKTWQTNFGNGYFGTTAVASAGTNASGNGIFEYDVPTGYTALSTKGLNL